MTAFPGATTISTGFLRAGDYTRLAAADGNAYQVSASYGAVSWYGRMYGVSNALTSLSVTYNGSASLTCSQTVALWNWVRGYWVTLDTRSVGTAAVQVTATAMGTLGEYVSGLTGDGDVAVRVRCTRTDTYTAFYSSGDLMKIVYTR